jgi:hypothetical protein
MERTMKHAGGWDYRSKAERKAYDHERYMADRERRLEQMKRYREAHKDELKAKRRIKNRQKALSKWEK